jgi:hypothetical protein
MNLRVCTSICFSTTAYHQLEHTITHTRIIDAQKTNQRRVERRGSQVQHYLQIHKILQFQNHKLTLLTTIRLDFSPGTVSLHIHIERYRENMRDRIRNPHVHRCFYPKMSNMYFRKPKICTWDDYTVDLPLYTFTQNIVRIHWEITCSQSHTKKLRCNLNSCLQ